MASKVDWLERWTQIAQIASLVAIPLVIAHFGSKIQSSIAAEGLKKDYVQIALGVLRDQPSAESEQLRKWAISVLAENSPVPIPVALRAQLETSKSLNFSFLREGDFKFEESIDCKAVPNPETLEWLIKTSPWLYTRCPDGQVGIKSFKPSGRIGTILSIDRPASK